MVLPLLETDLFDIMRAVTNGTLKDQPVRFSKESACCVVLASRGYPGSYQTGYPIKLPEKLNCNEVIDIAGAKLQKVGSNDTLCTSGGRVLGAVATAPTLKEAIDAAYALADRISFDHAYCRRDIGARALAALQK